MQEKILNVKIYHELGNFGHFWFVSFQKVSIPCVPLLEQAFTY